MIMTYEEWEAQVSEMIQKDPVWNFQVYRKALFLYDLAWIDCEKLTKDVRGKKVAGQLIGSVGSISANIEEGYGRGFGADYAGF